MKLSKQGAGTFDVTACMKWLSEKIEVESTNVNYLRECVLFDGTDHILLTIWGDLINTVQENTWYLWQQVNVKNYFGLKLSTTKKTNVTKCVEQREAVTLPPSDFDAYLEHSHSVSEKLRKTLCCPELLNVVVEIFPGCTNSQCGKSVTIIPGNKLVTCMHCNRTMRADKFCCTFNCILSFSEVALVLPLNIISAYFENARLF